MSIAGGSAFNMQPVTNQPMGFNPTRLEPNSRDLYNSLNIKHQSGVALTGKVNNAGLQLMENVQARVSARGNMSYNELLSGLIYKDEQIVSSDYMDYISLSVYDESFKLLHTKPAGKAILTNKRMLLMSTQYYENFSLTQFGDPKKNPGGYTMSLTCSDSVYYLPIPLRCFRSVEVKGQTGASGSISLHAQDPPCRGWCGICGCLKDWLPTQLSYAELNETDVTFGVLMPPWEMKTFLRLHLGINVPIQRVRDMLSAFQNAAPSLI